METKYNIEDLQQIRDPSDRTTKAIIFVANELHNIYSVLWEMKEKDKD